MVALGAKILTIAIRATPVFSSTARRENTRLTESFFELHNGGAVQPQCCSVVVGDAPQHELLQFLVRSAYPLPPSFLAKNAGPATVCHTPRMPSEKST